MVIIGEKRYVIETKLPKKQSAKKVDGVIVKDQEIEYEYMWFMGVGLHPSYINPPPGSGRQPIAIPMNMWTPYPAQAVKYKEKDEADRVNDLILTKAAGGYVLEWEQSHHKEGRQVIVPVLNDIVEGKTKSGIDGKGRADS